MRLVAFVVLVVAGSSFAQDCANQCTNRLTDCTINSPCSWLRGVSYAYSGTVTINAVTTVLCSNKFIFWILKANNLHLLKIPLI